MYMHVFTCTVYMYIHVQCTCIYMYYMYSVYVRCTCTLIDYTTPNTVGTVPSVLCTVHHAGCLYAGDCLMSLITEVSRFCMHNYYNQLQCIIMGPGLVFHDNMRITICVAQVPCAIVCNSKVQNSTDRGMRCDTYSVTVWCCAHG